MKTLVVHYTPRTDSLTKILVNEFLEKFPDANVRDLSNKHPALFDTKSMDAYFEGYFVGKDLSEQEIASLAPMKALADELLSHDQFVFAFPMWNYGPPAAFKAYIDCVTLKDITFEFGENGFEGLLAGKKALIIVTAGGMGYVDGKMQEKDHCVSWIEHALKFLGLSTETVFVQGTNVLKDDQLDKAMDAGMNRIGEVASSWSQ